MIPRTPLLQMHSGMALSLCLLLAASVSCAPEAQVQTQQYEPGSSDEEREILIDVATNQHMPQEGKLEVRLTNPSDSAAAVVMHASVISEVGADSHRNLRTMDIPGAGEVTVMIAAAELDLPSAAFATSGQLHLTVEVEFEDGVHRASRGEPVFFHPDTEGWELYDAAAYAKQYSLGALAPDLAGVVLATDAETVGIQYAAADNGTAAAEPPSHDPIRLADVTAEGADLAGWKLAQLKALKAPPVAQPKASVSKRFCFRVFTDYEDSGIGEDQYPDVGPTARVARGMRWTSGSLSGYTGDGITGSTPEGCTQFISVTVGATYGFTAYSSGISNGHSIWVQSTSNELRASHYVAVAADSSTTQWISIAPADPRFNVYMATAFSSFQHAGLNTGSVTVHTGADRSYTKTPNIYISTNDHDEKFVIAHEFGHYVMTKSLGGGVGTDCSYASSLCFSSGEYHITSKEYMSCAYNEGFPTFYAADVFNYHDEDDCWMFKHGNVIDCESANDFFPVQYLEKICEGPFTGFGVMLDWTRTFWDVHTNTTSEPTMNEILQWMEDANDGTAYNATNSYSLLDARANVVGGTLNSNWDLAKTANGIDH